MRLSQATFIASLLWALGMSSPSRAAPNCELYFEKAVKASKTPQAFEALHDFYKNALPCDDAGYAEGLSGAVADSLVSNWSRLGTLKKLFKDSKFEDFFWGHFEALVSASEPEMRQILKKRDKDCPKGQKAFCAQLKRAAKIALDYSKSGGI